MKRRRVLIIAAVVFVVAVIAVIVWPMEKEPEYQGRRLSQWLELADGTAWKSPEQEEARSAIRQIGTNALPYLIKWMGYEPSSRRNRYYAFIRRFPYGLRELGMKMAGPDGGHRVRVASLGFRTLGPVAAPAVPNLVPLMGSTNMLVSYAAMEAVAAVGKEGILPLSEALEDEQHVNRTTAIFCLSVAYQNANESTSGVPVLLQHLHDRDVHVAAEAVECLPRLADAQALPVLTDLVQTNPLLRGTAIYSFELLGQKARPAVPMLVSSLGDTNLYVRQRATNALRRIAPEVLETNLVTKGHE